MAERATDILDIEKRLLRNLLGRRREEISSLTSPVLILAHNLTPSEVANLDRQFVAALLPSKADRAATPPSSPRDWKSPRSSASVRS